VLVTPIQTLILDTDALPDSLKANLPPGGSLPTLPENRIVGPPTIEQLKDAVKVKKTTCAAVLAGYTCGNHDTASPPGNVPIVLVTPIQPQIATFSKKM
jgi:hypothetical protein